MKKLRFMFDYGTYPLRPGVPVVEMKLAKRKPVSKRIGVAKGKLHVPDDFDKWDGEIADMFGDTL